VDRGLIEFADNLRGRHLPRQMVSGKYNLLEVLRRCMKNA